jgi:hypothetical protein
MPPFARIGPPRRVFSDTLLEMRVLELEQEIQRLHNQRLNAPSVPRVLQSMSKRKVMWWS